MIGVEAQKKQTIRRINNSLDYFRQFQIKPSQKPSRFQTLLQQFRPQQCERQLNLTEIYFDYGKALLDNGAYPQATEQFKRYLTTEIHFKKRIIEIIILLAKHKNSRKFNLLDLVQFVDLLYIKCEQMIIKRTGICHNKKQMFVSMISSYTEHSFTQIDEKKNKQNFCLKSLQKEIKGMGNFDKNHQIFKSMNENKDNQYVNNLLEEALNKHRKEEQKRQQQSYQNCFDGIKVLIGKLCKQMEDRDIIFAYFDKVIKKIKQTVCSLYLPNHQNYCQRFKLGQSQQNQWVYLAIGISLSIVGWSLIKTVVIDPVKYLKENKKNREQYFKQVFQISKKNLQRTNLQDQGRAFIDKSFLKMFEQESIFSRIIIKHIIQQIHQIQKSGKQSYLKQQLKSDQQDKTSFQVKNLYEIQNTEIIAFIDNIKVIFGFYFEKSKERFCSQELFINFFTSIVIRKLQMMKKNDRFYDVLWNLGQKAFQQIANNSETIFQRINSLIN